MPSSDWSVRSQVSKLVFIEAFKLQLTTFVILGIEELTIGNSLGFM